MPQTASSRPSDDVESGAVERRADVVVVGAGPGGSATAAHLARRGLDVVLLEKATFPRDKICGDGLTPRAVRALVKLGMDISEANGFHRNEGLKIYGGELTAANGKDLFMPWPDLADFPDFGLTCARMELDEKLARHAASLGVELVEGANVSEPILDEKGDRIVGVRLKDGREFRAPVVVAADGVSSRLGVAMGVHKLDERPMGVAVRAYYKSPRGADDFMESWLELWDGEPGKSNVLPGYGWIFPMGTDAQGNAVVNVGLGMLDSSEAFGKTDYKDLMRTWLAATPPEWELTEANQLGPIRGAALPMGFNRKPAYSRGLLLVGDAGGMVNPFNGEGIDYALEAAEIAADAIALAHARGFGSESAERALEGYASSLQKAFGGYFRLGHVFAWLIGKPAVMHVCIKYGLPRKRLMRLVHKLLANLTDQRGGDLDDHIINTLTRLAPKA
ncbi:MULTISPECIES: geranylgeranyl reductase family protein [Luteococcus]|uniref:Electron transfer flavoprotein-ubiquinone oxidoreductase n=1 Tax=Luteococcus japonicus LSP_Lj1 TaxID=1255658 RepID=A0A1R4J2M3_9ACTN|nr:MULTISPECIES: geranylgeranyl reductase family protein [Luteococcus]MDN5562183.1 geranylgeranyl reductase family protein [Luteococcus sp.]SJN26307.1 Electron transfer flavoprotein-ubiquinone oxidoreductase [Luteococcus japonicus LSP_Lj1]